jgi:hypothetical protein
VVIAEPPVRPIERGLAGPTTCRFTAQEAICACEDLLLARQTICDWHLQFADLVELLVRG